jgi:hypothetical protein
MSSALIFEVMAMIGIVGRMSRMQTVAETPSRWGMIISIKTRSNWLAPLLILFTASRPSRYYELEEVIMAEVMYIKTDLQQSRRHIQMLARILILFVRKLCRLQPAKFLVWSFPKLIRPYSSCGYWLSHLRVTFLSSNHQGAFHL